MDAKLEVLLELPSLLGERILAPLDVAELLLPLLRQGLQLGAELGLGGLFGRCRGLLLAPALGRFRLVAGFSGACRSKSLPLARLVGLPFGARRGGLCLLLPFSLMRLFAFFFTFSG